MTNLLPREYNFRHEIMPTAVVGILLNLVVHYLVALKTDFVFADMSGTALVAILLGPWWAATVGVLSSAITGSFYQNFFPFGVVSIMGGLTWGYIARVPRIRAAIFNSERVMHLAYAWLIMGVSGGVVCGLFSTITKLILYPKMGLALDTGQPRYLNFLEFVTKSGFTYRADVLSLWAVDLIRDLADKLLVVLLALLFVQLMGFIPDAIRRTQQPRQFRVFELLKTDAISILTFSFTYAIYLLMARLAGEVRIRNAQRAILWLQEPMILVLLYTPIILAIVAFLLLSHGPHSTTGRRIDAERKERGSLFSRLVARRTVSAAYLQRSEVFLLLKSDGVYGLLITALLWPSKEAASIGPVNSIVIYFAVMATFAAIFFHQRREFARTFCQANSWLHALKRWLSLRAVSNNPESVLRMMAQVFKSELTVSEGRVRRHGRISYLPAVINSAADYLVDPGSSQRKERLLLVLPDRPSIIANTVPQDIDDVMKTTRVQLTIVLSNSPVIFDKLAQTWLRQVEETGKEILLLGPEDMERLICESARVGNVKTALAHARIHVMESLIQGFDSDNSITVELGVESLTRRTLPYLQHILETLPPQSRVLDLGAGRGRHSLAALRMNHYVVAIERNEKSFEDLTRFISQLGENDSRSDLRCEDYLTTTIESVGPIDLVINTGVLQHTRDPEDLRTHLRHIANFAFAPNALAFIEMLFDMTFDGKPPADGRFCWTRPAFEEILSEEFPSSLWCVKIVRGPIVRHQSFVDGPRSFLAPAKCIVSTSVEYLISREA